MLTLELEPATTQRIAMRAPIRRPSPLHAGKTQPVAATEEPTRLETASAAGAGIDVDVLRWMPVAVPMLAVLLCACIAAIWTLV